MRRKAMRAAIFYEQQEAPFGCCCPLSTISRFAGACTNICVRTFLSRYAQQNNPLPIANAGDRSARQAATTILSRSTASAETSSGSSSGSSSLLAANLVLVILVARENLSCESCRLSATTHFFARRRKFGVPSSLSKPSLLLYYSG